MSEEIRIPAWASRIVVEQKPSKLVVAGQGRVADLVTFASDPRAKQAGLIGGYISLIKGKSSPHIEFANAVRQKDQIAFVKEFGPIWGKVKRLDLGTVAESVVVDQSLVDLMKDHSLFRLAAMIASEVRESEPDIELLSWLILDVAGRVPFLEDGQMNMLEAVGQKMGIPVRMWTGEENVLPPSAKVKVRKAFLLHTANWALCKLLDTFPVHLTYLEGRVTEMPLHTPEGVLPVLYYLRRRDYIETVRRIATCASSTCKGLYSVDRIGQRYCCAECSRIQRGREYWHKRGKKLRRKRSQRKDRSVSSRARNPKTG